MNRHHQVPTRLLVVAVLLGLQGCANLSIGSLLSATPSGNDRSADQARVSQPTVHSPSTSDFSDAERHYQVAKYWLGQNRMAEALQSLDRALSVFGDHVEALNARASLRADLGRLQEARTDLDRALALAPDRVHLHYNSGLLHRMTGQQAFARDALERALRIDPAHTQAAELMTSLTAPSVENSTSEARREATLSNANTGLSVVRITETDLASDHKALIRVPQAALEAPGSVQAIAQESLPMGTTRVTIPSSNGAEGPSPSVVAGAEARPQSIQALSVLDLESTQPIQTSDASSLQIVRIIGATIEAPMASSTVPAIVAIRSIPAEAARIDIANANGINGMARALRGQLRAVGVQVATISNWSSFNQPVTRVLYREGYEQAARDLAQRMPIKVELVATERLPRADRDVMVVLGRDMRGYRATASGWESLAQLADFPAA